MQMLKLQVEHLENKNRTLRNSSIKLAQTVRKLQKKSICMLLWKVTLCSVVNIKWYGRLLRWYWEYWCIQYNSFSIWYWLHTIRYLILWVLLFGKDGLVIKMVQKNNSLKCLNDLVLLESFLPKMKCYSAKWKWDYVLSCKIWQIDLKLAFLLQVLFLRQEWKV